MKNYTKALRDLLIILIFVGAASLIISFIAGRNDGEFDADDRVSSFLQGPVGQSVGTTDELDLGDISFNEIDGVDPSNVDGVVDVMDAVEPEVDMEPQPVEEPAEPEMVVVERDVEESSEEADTNVADSMGNNTERTRVIVEGDTYGCIAEELSLIHI